VLLEITRYPGRGIVHAELAQVALKIAEGEYSGLEALEVFDDSGQARGNGPMILSSRPRFG
jgi:hypothetical protein